MTEHSNPDAILSDGREVIFSMNAFTQNEFLEIRKSGQTDEEEQRILSKASGIENIGKLGYLDYKKIATAFVRKLAEPVDPL